MKLSILAALMTLSTGITLFIQTQPPKTETIIVTHGNDAGIEPSDVCTFENHDGNYSISCTSGKSFKNVKAVPFILTGAPPWLLYSNLIGFTTKNSPFYAVAFCHGSCISTNRYGNN